ncbi:nitroreductase [Acetobacteraceae bacterium KSS8]|uniref:Putative NAD(P)H nitroreductase n=1 Tax=Endosaccharibacter trunci TaxID=2812733 RepID=A0ABT1W9X1_9PROT|nr:nitroreductase [Acetobacteraceae bacterium KSS8]
MSATDVLLGRSSTGVLDEPAPSGAVLERILECALRAPDHGKLRPWRFILVRGKAIQALADISATAFRRREPEASADAVAKQRGKMLRAPLVIALVARITPEHKIPEDEQLMSAAAASMNILNGAHAEGFAGIWITGANAYDPAMSAALGVQTPERLIGYIFVGTPREGDRNVARPPLSDHVSEWTGVSADP